MFLRAFAVISVLSLGLLNGCHCPESFGPEPPTFKVCHGPRILDEFAWFYADVNDVVFGIDYYVDLNEEFGPSPYH